MDDSGRYTRFCFDGCPRLPYPSTVFLIDPMTVRPPKRIMRMPPRRDFLNENHLQHGDTRTSIKVSNTVPVGVLKFP